jgi:hypothetical protein
MALELKDKFGKYVQIEFTLYSRKHKVTTYFNLFGYVMEIEDKNIDFRDNYNHWFIVPVNRIKSCTLAGERRTKVD